MSKWLVTSFEPFAGREANISGAVAAHLKDLSGPEVEFGRLPVSYRRAYPKLKELLESSSYSGAVLLGEAVGSEGLRLERYAHNWIHSATQDNDGQVISDAAVEPAGPLCLQSSAPIMKVLPDHPQVRVSLSAGSFVCNQVYYQCLWDYGATLSCLFVHVTDALKVAEQAELVGSILRQLTLSE